MSFLNAMTLVWQAFKHLDISFKASLIVVILINTGNFSKMGIGQKYYFNGYTFVKLSTIEFAPWRVVAKFPR